jgi:hypothetical protein
VTGRLTRPRLGSRAVTYPQKRPGPGGGTQGQDRRHLTVLEEDRPRFRFECAPELGGERPCPWVGCTHHLAVEVNERGGLKVVFPDHVPEALEELLDTCALDAASRGGMTLEAVAARMNLTRERLRQLEEAALAKVRAQDGYGLLELLGEALEAGETRDRRAS